MVSALGAVVLAVAVFLTWYRSGAAPQGAVPVRAAAALSGADALGGLAVVLLAIASLALLDTVAPLARAAGVVPAGAGGAVVLLGSIASALVAFRMLQPPGTLALSLREGPWVALFGSLMVSVGGVWPRTLPGIEPVEPGANGLFSALTGWTHGA